MAGTFKNQTALSEDSWYRTRIRACLMEQAEYRESAGTSPEGTWQVVYSNKDILAEKYAYRLASSQGPDYDNGVEQGLAIPSDAVSDSAILSGVQSFWDEFVLPMEPGGTGSVPPGRR